MDHVFVSASQNVKKLLAYLNIEDDLITSSSVLGVNHEAHRVILNHYFDRACAWAAGNADPAPWVRFDMGQEVTVWGVVAKPRCDYPSQQVSSLQVFKSDDGVNWCTASGVITTDYSVDDTSTTWFNEAWTARYWRIDPVTWLNHPSMKADLIGLPKGKACSSCCCFCFCFVGIIYRRELMLNLKNKQTNLNIPPASLFPK